MQTIFIILLFLAFLGLLIFVLLFIACLTDKGLCGALRAMRTLALEFLSKMRSGVERGAERNVHGPFHSPVANFFLVLYR